MRKLFLVGAGLLAGAITLPGIAKAEAPGMDTAWIDLNMSQEQCMAKANVAMRAGGFAQALEVVGTSTFGLQGQYRGLVRCLAAKKIVFFVVSGPNSDECAELSEAVIVQFRK